MDEMNRKDVLQDRPEASADGAARAPRYWVVGLAILGVVAMMIAGAYYLNGALRPRIGTVAASALATAEPTPAPTRAPTPVVRVVAPTSVAPTATPEPSPAAISSTSVSGQPTPLSSPSTSAVAPQIAVSPGVYAADPSKYPDIERAYLEYWQVYSDALLTWDTSSIARVATDKEQSRIQDEVNGFKQSNTAVRVKVGHTFGIFDVKDDEAKVIDREYNQSFPVDPVTKAPSTADVDGKYVQDIFLLKKVDGTWKVAESARVTP